MLAQVKPIILGIIYWKFQKTSERAFKGLVAGTLPGKALKSKSINVNLLN